MKKYFQAPWSLKDIIVVLFAVIIATSIYFTVNQLTGIQSQLISSQYKILVLIITFLLQWVFILGPLFILTKYKYELNFSDLGFKKVKVLPTVGLIILAYLLYLGIALSITLIIFYTGIKIPGYELQEKLLPQFGGDTIAIIVAGIIIVGLAPLLEEIFFRGFILRTLLNQTNTTIASIITAMIFAMFHFQLQSIIPIFIIALIINGLVIKTRSVWPAYLFHLFNNAVAFGIEVLLIKDVIQIESIL